MTEFFCNDDYNVDPKKVIDDLDQCVELTVQI